MFIHVIFCDSGYSIAQDAKMSYTMFFYNAMQKSKVRFTMLM